MTDKTDTTFDIIARIDSTVRMIHRAADFTTEMDGNFALDVYVLTKAILPDILTLQNRALEADQAA